MSDTRKGLLRAIGADTIGGPIDAVWNALRSTQLPDGEARKLAARVGLMAPVAPELPQDNPEVVGGSEWIARLTGVQGDSPEYNAARLGGNLGLMAAPWAWGKVANFKPRQGDLNMWLGPLARDYDKDKADKVGRAYERYMQMKGNQLLRQSKEFYSSPKVPSDPNKLSGADVDRFNRMAFDKYQTIIEPASRKPLQFMPETTDLLDAAATAKLEQKMPQYLESLYPEPALQQYPGLGKTYVEYNGDPDHMGAFLRDPSVRTTSPGAAQTMPFREGTMELNPEAHRPVVQGDFADKIHRGLMGNTVRHEVGHSIQASEKLPQGGSKPLMRDLGDALSGQYDLLKQYHPQPGPEAGSPYWIARGRENAANRAVSAPGDAYQALVGERLSQSAEVHNQPLEMVREYGLPKFDNSLVLEQGHINPIHLYTRGHLPPYTGDKIDPILGFKQAAEYPPGSEKGLGLFKPDLIKKATKPGADDFVPDYKDRTKVVMMPPEQFLGLASPLTNGPYKDTAAVVRAAGGQYNTLPQLFFDLGDGKALVKGHEGRHRATQAMKEGVKQIPVEMRGPIRWSEQTDPTKFDYQAQWPSTLRAQKGDLELPFPVPREEAGKGYHAAKQLAEQGLLSPALVELLKKLPPKP